MGPGTPSFRWDYARLFNTLASYAFEMDQAPPPPLLFSALAKRSDIQIEDMKPAEWMWLQWNSGFLKRVVNAKLPSALLYLVHNTQWGSFHTRDAARRTGETESKVSRWAIALMSKNLLKQHIIRGEKRVYYVADPRMPVVRRLCVELAVRKHGDLELERYARPNKAKAAKIEARKRAIREYTRRYRLSRMRHLAVRG
jgi:hypothetical protein